MLAGHTHGGQVCLPGVGALITNCDLEPRPAKGLHRTRRLRPGDPARLAARLGRARHHPVRPVRFACRPEATLLTLIPRRPT